MSVKWTGSQIETGILRKREYKEKKEELFVFGYSCKLFRDDDKAQHIDQGKHLIPWMGDETLKIDRYDARGALHDLSTLEAPPGGFDWRVELTRAELDVEQLCDEERYRALHTDEDEEEMYKEEELKRLHAAGYGQVGFNYDTTAAEPINEAQAAEVEEPFEPTSSFRALLPVNTVFPETQKQNAIIEKTAKFIASQGAQMEILIKAKQRDNLQFKFLNKDCNLNPYYTALIGLIKSGKWPEKTETVVEEKPEINEEYLHPSLASAVIESAPSIPSIHYKPSADCDYTMLISKMRGEATLDETYAPELAPGEVAPPGTEPLPPRAHAEISRAPVMYNTGEYLAAATNPEQQQYAAYYHQYMAQMQAIQAQQIQAKPVIEKKPTVITTTKSTGLSLMKNYNTDSDSDDLDFDDSSSSESKDKPIIITPPEDVKTVIDKMAAYVARNGDEFEDIVRSKNDPRFTFLEPSNIYHPFYKRLMQQKRGVDFNGTQKKSSKNDKAPVSFSIKKQKDSDPVLPKPALPYESSSEDEEGKETEKQEEPVKEQPKTNIPQITTYSNNIMPPVVVYKMEAGQINNLPIIKTIEPLKLNTVSKTVIQNEIKEPEVKELPVVEEKPLEKILPKVEVRKERTPEKRDRERSKERIKRSPSRERKKHLMKKSYRSEYRERSESRVEERERKKHKTYDRERKRERKYHKDELESEIISLEDNSNEMIDLTGEQSDSKVEGDTEVERAKQQERRKRAAEFLKKVGVDPAAAALPTTSLASAMVDTLESLRKKKSEEEKRKRREKRRRRDKKDYEDELDKHKRGKRKKNRSSDDEDDDIDSSKKKKRKKDKKHSTKNKKKKRKEELEEPQQINIDITNTLKELRSNSPTKELEMDMLKRESDGEKRKRKERDYSEGEWSSDSDADSVSSAED